MAILNYNSRQHITKAPFSFNVLFIYNKMYTIGSNDKVNSQNLFAIKHDNEGLDSFRK